MSAPEIINEGDLVLFVHKDKRWLVKVARGKKLQTHISSLDLGEVIGMEYGSITKDGNYYLFRPTLVDRIMKFERPTQIIYPKDASYSVLKLDLFPGAKVLELGTGSGAMTAYLANAVRPDGEVHTYDINEEYIETAKRNLSSVGLDRFVKFNLFKGDLQEGIYDAAFVDIGDPWKLTGMVWRALKSSRVAAFLLPTYDQLERLIESISGLFYHEETVEIFVRRLQVAKNRTRPQNFVAGHTAFLTFLRKTVQRV
ncbi:MAG: tRNA (adenine-N1)-methyltransferase [Nitrososphaeria archaeon]